MTLSRRRLALGSLLAALVVIASLAPARARGDALGTPARVSVTGGETDRATNAYNPSLAYDTRTHQYLAVWQALPDASGPYRIYGRLLDRDGSPAGDQFPISKPGPDCAAFNGSCQDSVSDPEVVYNATADEFFVVWHAVTDTPPAGTPPAVTPRAASDNCNNGVATTEVRGQRVSSAGAPVGPDDGPISTTSECGRDPQVRWASVSNQYLVTWGDEDASGQVFAQRVAADGTRRSDTEIPVSDTGVSNGEPDMAYDSIHDRWLVLWGLDDTTATAQIRGRLIGADGTAVGGSLPVSEPFGASEPAVAFNARDQQFLVVWQAELPRVALGAAPRQVANPEQVVRGRILDADGARLGTGEFKVSSDDLENATGPSATWDSQGNQYGVVYQGEVTTSGPEPHSDAFGQLLSTSGERIGTMGFNVSKNLGDEEPRTIVYNPDTCEYLTGWERVQFHDPQGGDKVEMYDRRLAAAPCADLSITKTPSSASVSPGATISYAITVQNAGPQAAANAVVTDPVPAGTSLVSASASSGSCSGTSTVTCSLGTIAAGASATITLVTRTSAAGTVTNTATVGADTFDPNAANNRATATTTVTAAAVAPAAPVQAADRRGPRIGVAGIRSFGGRCSRSSMLRLRVTVTDGSGIRRVTVLIDGKRVRRVTTRRFTVSISARRLTPGPHAVRVVATDRAGNVASRTVRIRRCPAARPKPSFTG